ncbi:MAG: Fe-S protein assembly co-chaperone HscB [Acidobacteriia bacterium]|jgi:molecular chaperone HscB|nr:Fe-S protein assembly co-chaperone HscB [Terriglobia bacterium]
MSETQTLTSRELHCWSCGAAAGGAHFCPSCGKIQPLPPDIDYFTFFGLPRRLGLDAHALEAIYHELSWRLHPDRFAQASEAERRLSLDRAAQLNDAFRTLRDPVRRVEYLLWLSGRRREGETRQQAPPELLEEVFELNEVLEELRQARRNGGDGTAASLRRQLEAEQQKLETMLAAVDKELAEAAAAWDRALDSGAAVEPLFDRLNQILNRRSYIRNLVENVRQELAAD